jgi:hypothetical protein
VWIGHGITAADYWTGRSSWTSVNRGLLCAVRLVNTDVNAELLPAPADLISLLPSYCCW